MIFRLLLLLVLSITSAQLRAQDSTFSVLSDSLYLNAKLSYTAQSKNKPVFVFIHGSGPNDMDQTTPVLGPNAICLMPDLAGDTIRTFADLSKLLLSQHCATVRFDKRSFTHGATLNQETISPYDFIDDVHAVISHIKSFSSIIDTSQIYLLGHSQGANFAPIVAEKRTDIAGVISIGTASTPIDTVMATQFRELHYACTKDSAAGNMHYDQTLSDFNAIRNQKWPAYSPYLGARPKFWTDWIKITDESVNTFANTEVPVLMIFAGDDFNVPVSEADDYIKTKSKYTTIVTVPNINHFLTPSNLPSVSPQVGGTILNWLSKRTN